MTGQDLSSQKKDKEKDDIVSMIDLKKCTFSESNLPVLSYDPQIKMKTGEFFPSIGDPLEAQEQSNNSHNLEMSIEINLEIELNR